MAETKESSFRRVLKNLSHKSRTKKFDLLNSVFRPRPEDRVLDVGASGEVFLQYSLEDVYPFPERIVAGGYEAREITAARRHYPRPQYALFDGCALPFPDQSFDLVFSNAVIEHILGAGRQEKFAQEIMRVGKSWFVTTPELLVPLRDPPSLAVFSVPAAAAADAIQPSAWDAYSERAPYRNWGCSRQSSYGDYSPLGGLPRCGSLSGRKRLWRITCTQGGLGCSTHARGLRQMGDRAGAQFAGAKLMARAGRPRHGGQDARATRVPAPWPSWPCRYGRDARHLIPFAGNVKIR